jgi:DNA-binding CsgD family transcriptional regulator
MLAGMRDDDAAGTDGSPPTVRLLVVRDESATAGPRVETGATVEIVGFARTVADAVAEAGRLGPDVLVVDLRKAPGEHRVFSPRRRQADRLSLQETRILEQVAAGRTNKEIAGALHLSFKTVKNYLSNAFQKLHVRRRMRAAEAFRKLREFESR